MRKFVQFLIGLALVLSASTVISGIQAGNQLPISYMISAVTVGPQEDQLPPAN